MIRNTLQIILSTIVLTLLTSGLMAQNCHIEGRVTVPELQGKNITVLNLKSGKPLASTKIVDSTFALDITVGEPFVGMLKTDPQNNNPRSYYFLRIVGESGNIYADLVTDSLSGSPLNDRLGQYWRKCSYDISVMNAIISQVKNTISMPESEKDRLRQDYDQRFQKFVEYLVKTYEANKNNAVGAFVMEDLLDYSEIDYESVLAMLEGAAPVVTTYPQLRAKLSAMEKVSHTAPGKQFIDLDLTDYKTGKPIKLSKVIKGKVALIDFWASWCGPCRREIPNLAKIQEKYGSNKDFVLVSLNVWDKPDAQAKAIKDMKMVWTQLTDATRNATDTYGVDGIPQILLIGKDGKIIARNLRGEDIEKAVKKALGK
ncbi:MAG: AhpC/TSA family protein [Bacteroidales bacterium]|nr:AhpC/TSA family protein [Bacteroidales bacterium]